MSYYQLPHQNTNLKIIRKHKILIKVGQRFINQCRGGTEHLETKLRFATLSSVCNLLFLSTDIVHKSTFKQLSISIYKLLIHRNHMYILMIAHLAPCLRVGEESLVPLSLAVESGLRDDGEDRVVHAWPARSAALVV